MDFKILIVIIFNAMSTVAEVHPSMLDESFKSLKSCTEYAAQVRQSITPTLSKKDFLVVTCHKLDHIEVSYES